MHSFKQPKLTRTLLAKWRALSADKRPTLDGVLDSARTDSTKDTSWVPHHSDDDEDSCGDAVAVIDIVRDHYAFSNDKLTRSEKLRLKEEAFLATRSRNLNQLTSALRVDLDGGDEKCSVEAFELSRQPYASMTLQDASEGFSKLRKGISLDEDIANDGFEEESNLNGLPTNNAASGEVILHESDGTGLPKDYKLTDSQKDGVDIMRKEMERGQMLVFIHGPPGSGKTTTARLLVSEKNLDLVFSGTTGTASSLYKAQTINSLLRIGKMLKISKRVKSVFRLR